MVPEGVAIDVQSRQSTINSSHIQPPAVRGERKDISADMFKQANMKCSMFALM